MKKQRYKARWGQAGKPSIANVSFDASSDANAQRRADKIARELNVTNTPRDIMCGDRLVESLTTGVSQ